MDITSYMLGKQAGGGGGGTSYTAGTNIEITNNNEINNKIPYIGTDDLLLYGTQMTGTTLGTGVALGKNVEASNTSVITIGENARSNKVSSIALGSYANSLGYQSMAIGASSNAHGSGSLAIGASTSVYGNNSIAIGRGASTSSSTNLCMIGSIGSPINTIKIYTSSGEKELATQSYVDDAISTAITSALGGSY